MKLFRNQKEYNSFSKNLCEIFDVDYVESEMPDEIMEYKKTVHGFEFQKGNKMGILNKGIPKSESHKQKMRMNNLGKKMSKESSQKKRDSMLGKPSPNRGKILTDKWRHNMSMASKGVKKSEFHKENLSKHLNSLPQLKCPHCGIEGRNAPMKRWHFDKCKLANNR